MSKPAVMVQLDPPILTKDTKVEVTSTGEPELRPDAPARAVTTVGALVDTATQGFRETVFDPQKRAEFTQHATTLGAIEDARVGASDTLVEVSQPPSKEKVAAALEGFTDAVVWAEAERRLAGTPKVEKGIKQVEIETAEKTLLADNAAVAKRFEELKELLPKMSKKEQTEAKAAPIGKAERMARIAKAKALMHVNDIGALLIEPGC